MYAFHFRRKPSLTRAVGFLSASARKVARLGLGTDRAFVLLLPGDEATFRGFREKHASKEGRFSCPNYDCDRVFVREKSLRGPLERRVSSVPTVHEP